MSLSSPCCSPSSNASFEALHRPNLHLLSSPCCRRYVIWLFHDPRCGRCFHFYSAHSHRSGILHDRRVLHRRFCHHAHFAKTRFRSTSINHLLRWLVVCPCPCCCRWCHGFRLPHIDPDRIILLCFSPVFPRLLVLHSCFRAVNKPAPLLSCFLIVDECPISCGSP